MFFLFTTSTNKKAQTFFYFLILNQYLQNNMLKAQCIGKEEVKRKCKHTLLMLKKTKYGWQMNGPEQFKATHISIKKFLDFSSGFKGLKFKNRSYWKSANTIKNVKPTKVTNISEKKRIDMNENSFNLNSIFNSNISHMKKLHRFLFEMFESEQLKTYNGNEESNLKAQFYEVQVQHIICLMDVFLIQKEFSEIFFYSRIGSCFKIIQDLNNKANVYSRKNIKEDFIRERLNVIIIGIVSVDLLTKRKKIELFEKNDNKSPENTFLKKNIEGIDRYEFINNKPFFDFMIRFQKYNKMLRSFFFEYLGAYINSSNKKDLEFFNKTKLKQFRDSKIFGITKKMNNNIIDQLNDIIDDLTYEKENEMKSTIMECITLCAILVSLTHLYTEGNISKNFNVDDVDVLSVFNILKRELNVFITLEKSKNEDVLPQNHKLDSILSLYRNFLQMNHFFYLYLSFSN